MVLFIYFIYLFSLLFKIDIEKSTNLKTWWKKLQTIVAGRYVLQIYLQ